MKKVCVVLVWVLAMSVFPVVAENANQESMALQAMSNLSNAIPMTDQQLDAVEGDGFFFIFFKLNYASNQRFMFQMHCGGFVAFHCSYTDSVSHSQGDVSPHHDKVSHPQGDVSPHHDKVSRPQRDVSPHQDKVSRPQGDISPHQNEEPHAKQNVSRHQDKRPHPRIEVSVPCTARDCSRRPDVDGVVDTQGGIHIEQITQGGGNPNNVDIVQQSDGSGSQSATVRQINRAAH